MAMRTLVLDKAQAPLGLLPVKEAVALLAQSINEGDGKVQALHSDESRVFRSLYLEIPAPVVVINGDISPKVLWTKVMPKDTARVTRRVLFARDRYECQYCDFVATSGRSIEQLTVDHVKPARLFSSRGEATTWENVATACRSCNLRKGGRLPMESGMMPRCTPQKPHFVQVRFAGRLNDTQRDYVLDWFGLDPEEVVL